MEFKTGWWGYDRRQVQNLLNQTKASHEEAMEKTRQLFATLESENGQLEAQLQGLQARIEYSTARAERLQESSNLVETLFTIIKDALVTQRREILHIADQMAEELDQRCDQIMGKSYKIDQAIDTMQKHIEEKLQSYQGLLARPSEEIARERSDTHQEQTTPPSQPGAVRAPGPEGRPIMKLVKNN